MIKITPELIAKYNTQGPRYTSYPTAPVWNDKFTDQDYEQVLATYSDQQDISLYIHIPFCQKRCLYCACNVSIKQHNEAIGDEYLDYLNKEMLLITSKVPSKLRVQQLHLGGGTPTFLTDQQLSKLCKLLDKYFVMQTHEQAIEIDPRTINKQRLENLKSLGFNRLSFGIQDFDEKVQKAVNREQPFAQVAQLFDDARSLDFYSINCDLIYGLPYQTADNFNDTIQKTIELLPERIALYSFAYVPWIHKHQKALKEQFFPTDIEKISLFLQARENFLNSNYCAIAMDHFALEQDELTIAYKSGTMRRNFMGYTTLVTDNYLGLGVSSIGYIGNNFVQNDKQLKNYYSSLGTNTLPIVRGYTLSKDDSIRQWVINCLMCQFILDKQQFFNHFEVEFDNYFNSELDMLKKYANEKLLTITDKKIVATDLGQFFIRNICMLFDAYLPKETDKQIFSKTV